MMRMGSHLVNIDGELSKSLEKVDMGLELSFKSRQISLERVIYNSKSNSLGQVAY